MGLSRRGRRPAPEASRRGGRRRWPAVAAVASRGLEALGPSPRSTGARSTGQLRRLFRASGGRGSIQKLAAPGPRGPKQGGLRSAVVFPQLDQGSGRASMGLSRRDRRSGAVLGPAVGPSRRSGLGPRSTSPARSGASKPRAAPQEHRPGPEIPAPPPSWGQRWDLRSDPPSSASSGPRSAGASRPAPGSAVDLRGDPVKCAYIGLWSHQGCSHDAEPGTLSPNPPMDRDGRRGDSGRG